MSLMRVAAPVVVGFVVGIFAANQAGAQAPSPAEAKAIATDAYLYAYPMLYNYKTLFQQAVDPSFPGYVGGFNGFRHYSRGFSPADKDIVTPSNDTPYSWAWLDLRSEPMVVSVPASPDRYYVLQWFDLYTHNFAYLGSRATGTEAGDYLFAGPGWSGETPQLERRVADQVGEIERMGRLRRFLPPQVADLIVASGAEKQLENHRREITALFCDLRGFTGFSESSDPEDVMALLREYHAAIGGIINKYGGTLERYAGDGVMVVFNDPIPVDNPALQAVLMAIEMRAAIGELIEKWRKLGHDIGFGIGIAHGFATLGTIGFEGRFDYAAIGTVSNVASRLCDEAKPGQILISPRVLMAVEKDITVEPVGDFVLKGIRRPLTAYNVLATEAAD